MTWEILQSRIQEIKKIIVIMITVLGKDMIRKRIMERILTDEHMSSRKGSRGTKDQLLFGRADLRP